MFLTEENALRLFWMELDLNMELKVAYFIVVWPEIANVGSQEYTNNVTILRFLVQIEGSDEHGSQTD